MSLWGMIALQVALTVASIVGLNGPFMYPVGWDGAPCPRCGRAVRHWHWVRTPREWGRLERPALGVWDWFPYTGRVWIPAWTAALSWVVGIAEVAGNGATPLGLGFLGWFAGMVIFLVAYVRRPVV
jgi:hypothetical protein